MQMKKVIQVIHTKFQVICPFVSILLRVNPLLPLPPSFWGSLSPHKIAQRKRAPCRAKPTKDFWWRIISFILNTSFMIHGKLLVCARKKFNYTIIRISCSNIQADIGLTCYSQNWNVLDSNPTDVLDWGLRPTSSWESWWIFDQIRNYAVIKIVSMGLTPQWQADPSKKGEPDKLKKK